VFRLFRSVCQQALIAACTAFYLAGTSISADRGGGGNFHNDYHHHHHRIRFWYLWCCGCPGLRGMVGNTWQRLTLVLHEFLSNGLTPSRLHIVISFLTPADHIFLGLPRFLVPGTPNRVMELMHEVARCMCPYHLRRRVRRTSATVNSRKI